MQVREGNLGGDFHLLVDHAERHGRHADADGFAYPYGVVGEPLAELLRESEAGASWASVRRSSPSLPTVV